MKTVLGLSAYYHDSAAALLDEGRIVAAVQEERFTRVKHDPAFPAHAIESCLRQGGLQLRDVDAIVFYDKPLLKFERLLETYLAFAPRGLRSFLQAMPVWLEEKLYLKSTLKHELSRLAGCKKKELPPLLFSAHHESHAASAFYPSPFEGAAVLCLDGVGEWATTSAWRGQGNSLEALWEIDFPHSLGLLYSAFTYFTGFRVNFGEYKMMGLAPYGEPRYRDAILDHLMDLKPDGTFRLDLDYFDYCTGLRMTNARFAGLFGGPPRTPESDLTQREMDLAASIQAVTEEVVLRLVDTMHRETGDTNLCLAGGVALNCVSNGRILRESAMERLWIQPAAGDAGGALGAALAAWHGYADAPRTVNGHDAMAGAYLGPSYDEGDVTAVLEAAGARYETLDDERLVDRVAGLLDEGKVVGWFQGRMEFGPRALGARSILGDPRRPETQTTMNLKIKYRESFRPFAPSVLAEHVAECFEQESASPYMLIVAPVADDWRLEPRPSDTSLEGLDRLHGQRSRLPAITHVDGSARIQTVHRETNPRYHAVIEAFRRRTGCPLVVNTSFNVRGEPIVCTPEDAWRCFMATEMDALAMGNVLLLKADQAHLGGTDAWRREFEAD